MIVKVKRKEIVKNVEEEYCDGCGKYLGEKYHTTGNVYCGDCGRTLCEKCYGDQHTYVDDNSILHIPCQYCRAVLTPAIITRLQELDKEEEIVRDKIYNEWQKIKKQSRKNHPIAKPKVKE